MGWRERPWSEQSDLQEHAGDVPGMWVEVQHLHLPEDSRPRIVICAWTKLTHDSRAVVINQSVNSIYHFPTS